MFLMLSSNYFLKIKEKNKTNYYSFFSSETEKNMQRSFERTPIFREIYSLSLRTGIF